eukprot:jgi/Mesvir1/28224/Mv04773-RA.1
MGDIVLHPPTGPTALVASVHPVVLFNICDSYSRRNDGQERVIGTLLGSISSDGVVDIQSSYAVPHNESMDQVALDIDFNKTMFELHQRVNPKETIVGWYSTGTGVRASDALIQDFYGREVATPVHLTVDTTMTDDKISVKAYVSNLLSLGSRQLAAQFQEIRTDIRVQDLERVGVDMMHQHNMDKLPHDLEGLESTTARLVQMIDAMSAYVDGVVEGRTPPDNAVGRYLADTIASIPHMSAETFEKMFNDSAQDVLLVLYLGKLTRAQLAMAEKLNNTGFLAV